MTTERREGPMIAILGAGWLGEALARRWLNDGHSPRRMVVTHRRAERRAELSAHLGCDIASDNRRACEGAELIIVAVRPQDIGALLSEIAPTLTLTQTVVSLASSATLDSLRQAIGPTPALCRVMLPPTVATGGGPFFAAADVDPSDPRIAAVDRLFRRLGAAVEWADDRSVDVLGVSVGGMSPYLSMVLAALMDWIVEHGHAPRDVEAMLLTALQSVGRQFAADGGFRASAEHAATPGGLTEAAYLAMRREGIVEAIQAGPSAMLERAAELRAALYP